MLRLVTCFLLASGASTLSLAERTEGEMFDVLALQNYLKHQTFGQCSQKYGYEPNLNATLPPAFTSTAKNRTLSSSDGFL